MVRSLPAVAAVLVLAAPHGLSAQGPTDTALSTLEEGTRIRTNGPGVRDQIGLSFGDILQRGIMAIIVRPPAEGVVVDATPGSFLFAASERSRLVDVPWSGVDYVDVYGGRSIGLGMLRGAGAGALGGLVIWGMVEFVFLAADNPVVDEPEAIIGITAGAGALLGAATLGDRWNRVYPDS